MCLILDANKFGDFLDKKNVDMQPVRDWHNRGNNSFVHSLTKRLKRELKKSTRMERNFLQWISSGKVRIVDEREVEEEETKLKNDPSKVLKSNDEHIIALALVSGTKLLVSEDKKLHKDFKSIVKGNVYQNKKHKRLLRQDTCP